MNPAAAPRNPPLQRLPLNRHTVNGLEQAGLGNLSRRPLDLSAARRLGQWAGQDGTACFLLSVICAATRRTALAYLERADCRLGSGSVQLGDQKRPWPELKALYPLVARHFPLPELAPALAADGRAAADARRWLLVELLLIAVQLDNPAAGDLRALFDDRELRAECDYRALLNRLETTLERTAGPGQPWQQPLGQLLRAPLLAEPATLADQLAYIQAHWAEWLDEELLTEIGVARAVAAEEAVPRMGGPGPVLRPTFGAQAEADEPPAFSTDTDWMPNCVLLAKSIYVWLDQLGRRYGRSVATLDAIPEEELARLARWGITALWLIGIWERSPASRRIKQLAGNPEAEASAYALQAYRVAADLGGETALDQLARRCARYGIRLATDVVPNHTGIDSEWLRQHPDWFVQTDQPPYPGYRFSGPDLSDDPAFSIRIEDGYWNHADAAVVFELSEHDTGRRRYIYHGNDGTHMPWNDTAQLNFLLAEVRQAMSDLILAVARRFRLIRFDAAMTLARKHFRRLWFPPPGGSAGVPSRSVCWLSDADFDRAFPVEFWREVVDRVRAEAPDTLLIAEAFWLMESYFVRNLGMHRVYNSAFMNLLKREENAKYRGILKDILAYNPEILQRYVNFMNNPDEATAVAQFGKGDKYFGTAVLLATLPGLPMFGHGQIEGLEEKYGMEYRRAYWSEQPDEGFIAYHERVICPLLRHRQLFSGAGDFALYDFENGSAVDENVFAYSNGPPGQRHLVVYNNAPRTTSGRVQRAVPKAAADREGEPRPDQPFNRQFGLDPAGGAFCRYRDRVADVEFLRPITDLQAGLALELGPYQVHVLHGFEVLSDPSGDWQHLHTDLRGQPVASLDEARLRLKYAPLWQSFCDLLDRPRLEVLAGALPAMPLVTAAQGAIEQLQEELDQLVESVQQHLDTPSLQAENRPDLAERLEHFACWLARLEDQGFPGKLLAWLWLGREKTETVALPLLTWTVIETLAEALALPAQESPQLLLERFGLDRAWREQVQDGSQDRDWAFVQLLFGACRQEPAPAQNPAAFAALVNDPAWRPLLGINRHAGQAWFNRERMTALCGLLALQAGWRATVQTSRPDRGKIPAGPEIDLFRQRLARAAATGYRLDKFLALE